ncbi:MAG: membrane protein insertase YidC [Candidatus Nomurabacteria bacterium]|nr:membrane protein insertase YidC [Candidatus Saccharibacteria bacterium]USN95886.1 MAG: membrane protein insertase YidC [Candidatus Nomurabacteria bacterium]
MFNTLIVQPIFNILVAIYALLPGHNFGVAIVIFTILIRLAMWPLVKKQLHHAKAMRKLQPELKRIKKASKGDKAKESAMVMELYKEREINPFSSVGLIILQLPIIIALYSAISKIVHDPNIINTFSYPFVQHLPWMKELLADPSKFDNSLVGIIDLSKSAVPKGGGAIYIPALILVVLSAIAQYFQGKQLMPQSSESKKLRDILREASEGKQADQSEMAAATGRFTQFMIPAFVLIFTISLPAALPLYWLTTSIVAIIQQSRVLRKDEEELEQNISKPNKDGVIEGEVIIPKKPKQKPAKTSKKSKKRRKK